MTSYLYLQLEQQLREQIRSGQLSVGTKMPSIREVCAINKVSKSTVLTAFARLEAEGLIQARAKSGYYICQTNNPITLKETPLSQPKAEPTLISSTQVILDIMNRGAAFDLISNSKHDPYNEQLRKHLSKALRKQNSAQQLYYDKPKGDRDLRDQLAHCVNQGAGNVTGDDIIVTNGCQHALMLALMVTTKEEDVVAVESPCFYGAIQLIEMLGRKVIEIPSSAVKGISTDALKLAASHWPIKALIVSPCFSTPTGASIPDESKQQLVILAQQHSFCIIEDDIYAELHESTQRARTIYSYDQGDHVILCSSLSKTLSRDLRIGWIVSKKYQQQILSLKMATTMANSISQQQGVAQFISEGGLDKHLKNRRQQLLQQKEQLKRLIAQHFPMAISASQPTGGMTLWLELPEHVDTLKLYHQARAQKLTVTPGSLFSAQNTYQHYIRLSYAHPWTSERIQALEQLAKLIEQY